MTTDQQLKKAVVDAVVALNTSIRDAVAAGLTVDIGNSTLRTLGYPECQQLAATVTRVSHIP